MRAILLFSMLVLSGCVTTGATVLTPGLPPTDASLVAVFFPSDSLPEHVRVAILEAEAHSASGTDVLNKLRQRAAQLGADGIVVFGTEGEDPSDTAMRALVTGYYIPSPETTQAVAIKIK